MYKKLVRGLLKAGAFLLMIPVHYPRDDAGRRQSWDEKESEEGDGREGRVGRQTGEDE